MRKLLAVYLIVIFSPIVILGANSKPLTLSEAQSGYIQSQVLPQIKKQIESQPVISTGQYLSFSSSDKPEVSTLWTELENRGLAWHSFALGSGYHIWYSKLSAVKEFLESNIHENQIRRDALVKAAQEKAALLAKAAQEKATLLAKAAEEKARLELEEKKKGLVTQASAFDGMWIPYNQTPTSILKIKAVNQSLKVYRCKPDRKLLKTSLERACLNNFDEFPETYELDKTQNAFCLQGAVNCETRFELKAEFKILSLFRGQEAKRDFLLVTPERLLKLNKENETDEAEMQRQLQSAPGEWIYKSDRVFRVTTFGEPGTRRVLVEDCLSEPWPEEGKYCQPVSKGFLQPQIFIFNIDNHKFENKELKLSFEITENSELNMSSTDGGPSVQFLKVTSQFKSDFLSRRAAENAEKKRQITGLVGFWFSDAVDQSQRAYIQIKDDATILKYCDAAYVNYSQNRHENCNDSSVMMSFNDIFRGVCIPGQNKCDRGIRLLDGDKPLLIYMDNPIGQAHIPDSKKKGRIFYKLDER